MVWLPASFFDPQGETLLRETLKLLYERIQAQRGNGSIPERFTPPRMSDLFEHEREIQREFSFLLWQLATNPNPRHTIGKYALWTDGEEKKTWRRSSFHMRIIRDAPSPDISAYYAQAFSLEELEQSYNSRLAALWKHPDAKEGKTLNLTTGKLAFFLEHFVDARHFDRMPEELRRDMEARAHALSDISARRPARSLPTAW